MASGAIVGGGQYLFDDKPSLLLLIPLLGLGISILVSQHDLNICGLCKYCADDLEPRLRIPGANEGKSVVWENSDALHSTRLFHRMTTYRSLAYIYIVLLPSILALVFLWFWSDVNKYLIGVVSLSLFISVYFFVHVYLIRKRLGR